MDALASSLGPVEGLPPAERRMVERYLLDLHAMVSELARVVRGGGTAVLVVGNPCIRGVFLKNARALRVLAGRLGFELVAERERGLPPNRRYLPPPRALLQSDVEKRMRTETVLSFRRG
jgi:hypothetical protein